MREYASVLLRQSAPEGSDWRKMPALARALLLARASVLPLTVLGSGQGLLFAWYRGTITATESGVSGILLGIAVRGLCGAVLGACRGERAQEGKSNPG